MCRRTPPGRRLPFDCELLWTSIPLSSTSCIAGNDLTVRTRAAGWYRPRKGPGYLLGEVFWRGMPSYASGVSTRRDVALDTILAGSLCAWGQAEVWNSGASLLVGPRWANAAAYAIMSVLLLARRRAPVLVLTGQSVTLIAVVMAYGASETLGWFLPLIAGGYAVAAYGRQHRLVLAAAPALMCYG